jgi:hypothetical protein
MAGLRHAPAALLPGRDPVSNVKEAGWVPDPVSCRPGASNPFMAKGPTRYRGQVGLVVEK